MQVAKKELNFILNKGIPKKNHHELTSREVLLKIFGYNEFRSPQEEVIYSVIQGNSLMLLLATGGGKSLCYQIPSIVRPGTGIIISPLVSLMDDQVNGLKQRGVQAGCLHSGMSANSIDNTMRMARCDELDILYVSPEKLMSSFMLDMSRRELSVVAIDECHVVSSWGHEFRPAYREIPAFLRHVNADVPIIALTATADAITIDDVQKLLKLKDSPIIRSTFDRPKLFMGMKCVQHNDLKKESLDFISKHSGQSGIIYCSTQKLVTTYTDLLSEAGYNALPYHAGMSSEQRRITHQAFLCEDDCIVVATIAFGMGIDKPTTRWVLHIGLPASPESWYQEIGRAGRDEMPSETLLLWSESDVPRKRILMVRSSVEKKESISNFRDRWSTGEKDPIDYQRFARQRFEIMVAIARSANCRRRSILAYLDKDTGINCGHCDACINPINSEDNTFEVKNLLSLIKNLSASYGVFYLCEILLGLPGEKIETSGHSSLSEYGILKNKHRTEVSHIILQCASMGLISMPPKGRGGFSMTEYGITILDELNRTEKKIMMSSPPSIKTEDMDKDIIKKVNNINTPRRELLISIADRESKRLGVSREQLLPNEALDKLCEKKAKDNNVLMLMGLPVASVLMTKGAFLNV